MNLQITGILKLKKGEQVVSDRFRKREFVLTDSSSQYPQHISFQLTQDKCGLLDNVREGDTITVHFNLRGREWTSPQGEVKYFNTLEAWKLDNKGAQESSQQNAAEPPVSFEEAPMPQRDDLPF